MFNLNSYFTLFVLFEIVVQLNLTVLRSSDILKLKLVLNIRLLHVKAQLTVNKVFNNPSINIIMLLAAVNKSHHTNASMLFKTQKHFLVHIHFLQH